VQTLCIVVTFGLIWTRIWQSVGLLWTR